MARYGAMTKKKMPIMHNKWIDSWINMPRGQRRAIVVLLCVVVLLCGVQAIAWSYRRHVEKQTTDYSVLEQEIENFRSLIDTIPVDRRRPTYVRRTHARPDSVMSNNDAPNMQNRNVKVKNPPRRIEEVQRVK